LFVLQLPCPSTPGLEVGKTKWYLSAWDNPHHIIINVKRWIWRLELQENNIVNESIATGCRFPLFP